MAPEVAPSPTEWCVVVGRVSRPHGTRGELRVVPLSDRADRFSELTRVAVFPRKGPPVMATIVSRRGAESSVLLRLDGVNDRPAAEVLRGAELRIRKDMRYALEPGEYWIDDLVGVAVVTEDGRDLGTISEVLTLPGNDVYVTEHCLIPAITEVIRGVDLEGRRMVVHAMPGLAPELGI